MNWLRRADFAFETTLAGRSTAPWLQTLRDTGYMVDLHYFWLSSADLAVARVAARVTRGGHHVPEATIRRRYTQSIQHFFQLYQPVASKWHVYDNSNMSQPIEIAFGGREVADTILVATSWEQMRKEGGA